MLDRSDVSCVIHGQYSLSVPDWCQGRSQRGGGGGAGPPFLFYQCFH